jgi:hypothetical protein
MGEQKIRRFVGHLVGEHYDGECSGFMKAFETPDRTCEYYADFEIWEPKGLRDGDYVLTAQEQPPMRYTLLNETWTLKSGSGDSG